jgi:hypothetical protein
VMSTQHRRLARLTLLIQQALGDERGGCASNGGLDGAGCLQVQACIVLVQLSLVLLAGSITDESLRMPAAATRWVLQ